MYEIRDQVVTTFQELYGRSPDFLVRAPGRANLIGEHTDYNGGFVMPLAVDRALWLAAARRSDDVIRIHSLDFAPETVSLSTQHLLDEDLPHWSRHIRGAWWLLDSHGVDLTGADIVLASNIPVGAGMSSSAAVGVAVIEATLALADDQSHSQIEKALLAVDLEHKFLHIPCGVMDQIASAAAIAGSAMLLDCRSLDITPVSLPSKLRVIVMNTMKSRELADSAYAERRRQCEKAALLLGVPALRDATLPMIIERRDVLGDVLYRRTHHVVTENERTLLAKDALERKNLDHAGRLLNASHWSLKNDYEVSCHELDLVSDLARTHAACFGARMMGGGFGGSAVALVHADGVNEFIKTVAAQYTELTDISPEFHVCRPSSGSSVERFLA
jgi:galactokinase